MRAASVLCRSLRLCTQDAAGTLQREARALAVTRVSARVTSGRLLSASSAATRGGRSNLSAPTLAGRAGNSSLTALSSATTGGNSSSCVLSSVTRGGGTSLCGPSLATRGGNSRLSAPSSATRGGHSSLSAPSSTSRGASSGQGEPEGASPTLEPSVQDPPGTKKARVSVPHATAEREESLWAQGFEAVCGVDEAGCGPLAGPVVAAACVIPQGLVLPGVKDSKKLSEKRREELFEALLNCPDISYAIELVEVEEIDRVNIHQAALSAMAGAVQRLALETPQPLDYILVDGPHLPKDLPAGCQAEAVVKGDYTCRVIAAASILAKVTRDRMMRKLDREYPVYKFSEHKGYGTGKHMDLLLKHGPCPAHRRSFAPLKNWDAMRTP